MKLAEALAQRADVQRRLKQVEQRAEANARHLEGEEPAEKASDLIAEAMDLASQLEGLIKAVNDTNSKTMLTDAMSLSDALAARDILSLKQKFLTRVADAATGSRDRYGFSRTRATELKEIASVDVRAVRDEADQAAADHRKLDTQIQAANWSTELVQVTGR